MLFTPQEIVDMVLMTFIIGYIFKDIIPEEKYPPIISLEYIQKQEYHRFIFAMIAVAPAILLHELGHKFAAMAFGIQATFHAAYGFLLMGLVLKVLQFPFIFFIPAYVSHGHTTILASMIIALAGPVIHACLWMGARFALAKKLIPQKYRMLAFFTQYINGFLFVLNMLPIPGFDGYHALSSIFSLLFP